MRFAFRFLVLASCIAAVAARADVVVNFQDLTVPGSGYFNGNPGTLTPGQSVSTPWSSGSVSFANTFGIDSYGDFNYEYWNGFAYSNVVNTTNPAFINQYASYPGGGDQLSTYAVAYDEATVTLPVPTRVAGFRIANTTYAALTMLNGDQYGFTAPLASGTGWFATTATGKLGATTTGSTTFYLADLRGASPPGILATWAWFDLASLGTVDRIEFSFDGSDKNAQGLLTPAYFAMDDLTISAVPEPATVTLLAVAALVGGTAAAGRWRRRGHAG
jgi:hypothetical protein